MKRKVFLKGFFGYGAAGRMLLAFGISVVCGMTAIAAAAVLDRLVKPGDYIEVGQEIKNLSETDGAVIDLAPLYTPNTYKLRFECGQGAFSDGQRGVITDVVYNDGSEIFNGDSANPGFKTNESYITAPKAPIREGYDFVGWFLKGNKPPTNGATPDDGELIGAKCRYNIANDDAADLALTEHGSDGIPVARALWRKNTANGDSFQDGNGPDQQGSGQEAGHTGGWDELNNANQVIEYIEAYPTKAMYREKFGVTDYSYRRLILNAETDMATAYSWYVKKKGENTFKALGHTASAYKADKLSRADNGDVYRCEVRIGSGGAVIVYELPVRVWYLPEITNTEIYVDGQREAVTVRNGGMTV